MTRFQTRRYPLLLVTVIVVMAVGACGGPAATVTSMEPEAVAQQPAVDRWRAWTIDGWLVAVRRSPLPAGAYGNHGVDYSPESSP